VVRTAWARVLDDWTFDWPEWVLVGVSVESRNGELAGIISSVVNVALAPNASAEQWHVVVTLKPAWHGHPGHPLAENEASALRYTLPDFLAAWQRMEIPF
jgi:hypothetical protein